jgi:hypothetical protein
VNKNVGGLDRTARIVLGVLLLLAGVASYAGFFAVAVGPVPQALASLLVVFVGLVVLGTGLTRTCLVYKLLNVDTSR